MIDQTLTNLRALHDSWARTVTSMVWGQWVVLDTGLQAAHTVLQAAGAPTAWPFGPRSEPPARHGNDHEDLVRTAIDRMRQGLAPPREVHAFPHRERIDWSLFPEWARPTDPDLFEGAHEG
jgi:hypothetical protein